MSLTSHLADPASPIYTFVHQQFPSVQRLVAMIERQLRGADMIRPDAGATERKLFGIAGTAVDYRLRYYFPPAPAELLVAAHGAALITNRAMQFWGGPCTAEFPPRLLEAVGPRPRRRPTNTLVDEFFEAVQGLPAALNAPGRRLDPAAEERLVRHCYVLALFERIFRDGFDDTNPLFHLPKKATVGDLLACAPELWVGDICRLSWRFEERCRHLFDEPVVPNPGYDGSLDVSGADSDLILGDCFVDIKCRTCPRFGLAEMVYQLLGYVLLDYSDRYAIRSIGIYFARQGVLVRWSLEEVFAAMSCSRNLELGQVRNEFHDLIDRIDPEAAQRRVAQVHKLDWYAQALRTPSLT